MHTQFGLFCLTAKRPEMESREFKHDILCIFKLFIGVYVSIFYPVYDIPEWCFITVSSLKLQTGSRLGEGENKNWKSGKCTCSY